MELHFGGIIGLIVLLGIGFALSSDHRRIPWRIVIGGVALQFLLVVLFLKVPATTVVFEKIAAVATRILQFSNAGAEYIFGQELFTNKAVGFVFAIHVLPTIIFFASFMSILYHIGLMQRVVGAMSWVMNRTMGVSGAESLAMAANVFVGQTEAPLVVRPYVSSMTRSELMTLMTGGFATIAGGVFAAYVSMLGGDDAQSKIEFARHLLMASVMSAPAAFVMAKLMIPETEVSKTSGKINQKFERTTINVLDAATTGASDGLRLAANVGAMLLALIALVSGVDYVLGWIGESSMIHPMLAKCGIESLSLQSVLGLLFSPLAWAMGVESGDIRAVGSLLGQKICLTEFIAYDSLSKNLHSLEPMQHRSGIIATYALCGFANFGSIAIQLGGIGGIAPDRRKDLAKLGFRAMIGGAMASFMTATIAGIVL
ncbi:MAG TPA: nucleoside transporter C-terminal domain-containing protein [Phycisphaerae bacterium]|nr:nucleoside transporter C-terminal domain-containing protein [Phycisphaerae bacterium]